MAEKRQGRRQVTIRINGKEVENEIQAIRKEARALTRNLSHMKRGSQEYNETMGKIRKLNGILSEHRMKLRGH